MLPVKQLAGIDKVVIILHADKIKSRGYKAIDLRIKFNQY